MRRSILRMLKIEAVVRLFSLSAFTKKESLILVALAVGYAAFEGFGIGLLMPVLQYIESGPRVLEGGGQNAVWEALVGGADAVGIPINLLTLLTLSFLPILARQVVYFANGWYGAIVQNRAVTRLRMQGFLAVANADLSFLAAEGHGNLLNVLASQVFRSSGAIYQFLQMVASGVLILLYAAILLLLSPPLTLIAIASAVVVSVLVRSNLAHSRRLGAEVTKWSSQVISLIDERIRSIRLIKLRGQEEIEARRVRQATERLAEKNVGIAVAKATLEVTIDPALMLAAFVIIYFGVESYGLSLAGLGLFLFVLLRLNQKAREFNSYRQALAGLIDGLMDVRRTIERAEASRTIVSGQKEFSSFQDAIEFREVVFRYPESDQLVLDHVSLEIPKGSLVALVGRSGAGKSTLADLVPRLRDTTSGEILFDGVPIKDFDIRSLRRHMGFMAQEAILFRDTIKNNLNYGLGRDVTQEEIERALSDSHSQEFIDELPDGIETNIGDRGVRLSGGQRQRLALARVLLQDPDILILDEPTSALDSESEKYIQQALDAMHGDRTLLVIAHRLSTVQRADAIYVLEQGRVAESGTHAELLKRSGAYKKLFELQIQTEASLPASGEVG